MTAQQIPPVSRPARAPSVHLTRPDGARLALYIDGPDTPDLVVVFAHGWQAAASIWERHADELMRRHPGIRVVRYDQRGHGASTPGSEEPSISLLADDLRAIVQDQAPDGLPVILVGHSMGGMAVLALAADHPQLFDDQVVAVVLAATTSGALDLAAPLNPVHRRLLGLTRHAMAALCLRAPRPAERVRDLVRPRPYPQPPIDIAARWYRALMTHDVTTRLEALRRVRVHLVVGEADRHIPPVHAVRLAAQIPGAVVHLVPRGGHRLPTQHPREVQAVLVRACTEALDRVTVRPGAPRRQSTESGQRAHQG
ncbi:MULTISPECIES: alpha/beta fold hydrolase [Streptomyces]|uniref:Alpha/beta hydrolase fold protein n=1 Tax=Streptomyces zinciresistens K42 TaxID=700597 RepID=G2GBB9_9ACTN|nr:MULTISPECIES: alpha/beta hydrolase [Streptomyces]EGX59215.1 alpha/beta hydrolase fold protein [Streptomyces zinciresistens K42]MDT9696519.1 alpha/beta hydrolase [Streptomyces sp. P17]